MAVVVLGGKKTLSAFSEENKKWGKSLNHLPM